MFKKLTFLLAAIILVASCKPKKDIFLFPENEQEVAASLTRQYHDGGITNVIECNNGNIIVVTSYPWLIQKLSTTDGSIIWSKDLDDIGYHTIESIAPLPAGGFVATGSLIYPEPGIVLTAFDANGNKTWQRSFTEPDWNMTRGTITITKNYDIMVVTNTIDYSFPMRHGVCVLKVKNNGQEISRKITEGYESLGNLKLLSLDDGSTLAYFINSGQLYDGKLIKYDQEGNPVKSLIIHEAGKKVEPTGIAETSAGLICVGVERINEQTANNFMAHISSDLGIVQKKTLTSDSLVIELYSITPAKDGAIAVGMGSALSGKTYPVAIKVDNTLNVQWQQVYPAVHKENEYLWFVTEVNGRYVAAGNSWDPAISTTNRWHFLMDFSESGKAKE
jgi:hypothetical protein